MKHPPAAADSRSLCGRMRSAWAFSRSASWPRICAVPLILYDRPIGVMAVHSRQERAFDEGHVELLRVLASEAAIAIENARLFSEEQKKSRHLSSDQQRFEPRHHHAQSRRNALEDRQGNRKRPHVRPHRNRDSRLFGQGTRHPGRGWLSPRRPGPPHHAGRRLGRPGGALGPNGASFAK